MEIERRQRPRVRETALGLWARWIRMSITRRVIATLLTTAAIGGTTFAACNADRMTGPGSSDAPRVPRASVVVNEQRVPINRTYPNPCLAASEAIAFSGYLHTLITVTVDQDGGVHLENQVNETSLTGEGLISGKVYRASNELHSSTNDRGPAPLTTTVIDNFRIIGPEPNDNFYVRLRTHVTTNANGVPTAEVDEFDAECR